MSQNVYLLKNYINKDTIKVGDYYINNNQVKCEVTSKLVSLTEIILTISTSVTTDTFQVHQGLSSTLKDCLSVFGQSITENTTNKDIKDSLDFFNFFDVGNRINVLKSSFIEYLQDNRYFLFEKESTFIFTKIIYTNYNISIYQSINEEYETSTFVTVNNKYLASVQELAKNDINIYRDETSFLLSRLDNINLNTLKQDLTNLKNRLVVI